MTAWPRPDFLAGAPRRPVLAWLIAGSGAIALASAGLDAATLQGRADRLGAAAMGRTVDATRPARAASPTAGEQENTDRAAAQRIAAALAWPWPATLASIEAATPPEVRWLGLDLNAESGTVRLEGLAADAATALGMVDALAARHGWRGVSLTRLQPPATATRGDALPIRFSVEARLAGSPSARRADAGAPVEP